MGDAGANSASPFFFFSPFFPDGRGFGSARREQYAARTKQLTIRAGRSHLPCGNRWQAPCGQTDVHFYLMRWQTAVWDASQIVCLLQRISPWWMLCMLAGHIAHGGNILGEAKAGYRRANDKGQWWEAGASDKTR